MMEGWRSERLIDVCEVYQPKTISQKEMVADGLYPVFGANGIIGRYSEYNHEEPQLLITCRGATCGSVNVSLPKSWVTGNAMVIRPKDNSIRREFLEYLFKGGIDISGTITGTAQPQITRQSLGPVQIPIPPLPEQERIVAKLDAAFSAIDQAKANVERNLHNAKELFQSKLNEVFSGEKEGWVEKKLGDLGTLTSSRRIFKSEYVSEGVPFYRSKEIKELGNGREISLELFITKERYEEIKKTNGIPQKGDILLTAVGTIGEMYVVQENETFYFKDGNIMWLKDFDTLDTYFLKYALTSFVEQLKALSHGSAYSALTIQRLKEYSIPVPDRAVQKQIVEQLDLIKESTAQLQTHYTQKLKELDDLKKSLLERAFRGEI